MTNLPYGRALQRDRSQWKIFAFWWFLSDISATRRRIYTKFYLCRDNVFRRAPYPFVVHRPQGGGGWRGSQKLKKWGVVSFVLRTSTISIFLSASKCGSICRAQTCAHSGDRTVIIGQGVSTWWAKKFEKISIFFTISRL